MKTIMQWVQALFFTALVLLVLTGNPAAAEPRTEVPLWEVGVGIAPITMPSYRGSQTQEWYPVPLPYVDYRGEFLRMDREGIRGLVYDSDRVRIDFSGDGAIPSASDDDGPRAGMPDLDPVGEVGPSINFIIEETFNRRIRLRMPVRWVVSTDFSSLSHVGWKLHPHLGMDFRAAVFGWNAGIAMGPLFADRGYHGYYYDVKPKYIESLRPAYKAGSGYSGTMMMLSSSRRFERVWAGFFLRYDNLDGASFIDSPLVETRHAFMAGAGIAYIFGTSDKTVPATRDDFY